MLRKQNLRHHILYEMKHGQSRFFSVWRAGIELYCAPTADARRSWQASMIHIALEGGCFVLSANQFCRRHDYPPAPEYIYSGLGETEPGPEEVVCAGGSVIISPAGTILAGPNFDGEALITADLGKCSHYLAMMQLLKNTMELFTSSTRPFRQVFFFFFLLIFILRVRYPFMYCIFPSHETSFLFCRHDRHCKSQVWFRRCWALLSPGCAELDSARPTVSSRYFHFGSTVTYGRKDMIDTWKSWNICHNC